MAKPGNDLLSYVIDGMIQGVSQQSPWDRRDTQCAAQFDQVNSPVNGAEARPGFDVVKRLTTGSHSTAFNYEIFRGDTEHYLVVIDAAASGSPSKKLHVYDMNTGDECTITYVAYKEVTISIATAAVIAWPGNTFALNQIIQLDSTGNLPEPFLTKTNYCVTTVGDNLQVSDTLGGSPINTTGSTQNGTHTATARIATPLGLEDYLGTTADPRDSLMATTLQDFTFLGNRETVTRMSTTKLSSPAKNAGIVFVKAGGYLITYQLAITYNGNVYTWNYVTPDNSTAANAAYISTNQIAAAFFRSLTGVDAVVTTSGDTVPGLPSGNVPGVGPAGTGDTTLISGASFTGSTTATSLGFTVSINGNCLLISRDSDDDDWDIDTGDGVGNTYFLCAKDTVQNFDDLPASCFSGFTVKVIGSNQQTDDDYFVQFIGADGSNGYWQEVIAPATSLTFDESTMPLALVNTGLDTFDLQIPPWGNRVAGDGVFTALDPSFIGTTLEEMSFDNGRFALMAEGSCVWSRAIQNFVFFPDSAQTTADSDPIDVKPAGGSTIALLRRIVHIAETTFLWAEKIQFRATSGVNPFTAQTVELPPSTNYEFSPLAIPRAVGQSLYFGTELGAFLTLRDLSVQNNLPVGATDVTGHVKKYIPSGLRWITASDTLGVLFCVTDGAPQSIFLYNYLLSATARLQSAWNTWRLPSDCTVLWAGMDLNYLYAMVQRTDGAYLLRADLSVDLVDSDAGSSYHTRLDMRVTEAACTATYDAATNVSTVTLPFNVPEGVGWDGSTPSPIMFGNRLAGTRPRGNSWVVTGFPTLSTVTVKGNLTGDYWYAGFRIRSERTMSRFYIKTTRGLVPTHRLQVKNLEVNYGDTGYFRAEVTDIDQGTVTPYPMTGRIFGDDANTLGSVALADGTFKIPVNSENTKHSITLVNDSFLPSQWTSCVYEFVAAYLAKPSEFGQSVPSYFNQGGSAGAGNNF